MKMTPQSPKFHQNRLLQPLSRLSRLLLPLTLIIILSFTTVALPAEDIDFDRLVPCVIKIESGGDPNAVSPAGCIGLMQINPRGALAEWQMQKGFKDYNVGDLYNPHINVYIGTWYLKRLYHYYKCDTLEKILMAYNFGIGNCIKTNFNLNKAPKETRDYIRKVKKLYDQGR